MDFKESLTIEVPDIEDQVARFSESEYASGHGLIIEVAAIHSGLTANFNNYPEESLEAALTSWVSPYPKPIILNHDTSTEPLGRVMAAKMAYEDDGTPYTMLQIAITDPEAVAKVSDKRYLTGSVGGSAKRAICSVCSADWAEASLNKIPCSHRRGKTYKGQLAYFNMSEIEFNEYSFVNVPADKRSHVRSTGGDSSATEEGTEVDDSGWVRTAKVFALSMDSEEILEFSESQDGTNVLSDMKRKEATPAYMQIKGAFISTLAMDALESTNEDKESEVQKDEDDILAVTENLSAELAEKEEETAPAPEEEEVEDTDTASTDEGEKEEAEETASDEKEEETPPAAEDETEEEEEEKEEEAPKAEDSDDSSTEQDGKTEEADQTAPVTETDLDDAKPGLESRVEELEQEVTKLTTENTNLKAALKRQLAERVVDAKISRGFGSKESRTEMIEEHATRSASSLADSLKDLASMQVVVTETAPTTAEAPKVEENSVAVTEPGAPVVTEGDPETPPVDDSEDVLVDVLMGRRKI